LSCNIQKKSRVVWATRRNRDLNRAYDDALARAFEFADERMDAFESRGCPVNEEECSEYTQFRKGTRDKRQINRIRAYWDRSRREYVVTLYVVYTVVYYCERPQSEETEEEESGGEEGEGEESGGESDETEDDTHTCTSCKCLCKMISSSKTVTIEISNDLSRAGGGITIDEVPDDTANGNGSNETVRIENQNRYRQRNPDTGDWQNVPDWIILAHELCGHALPGIQGVHPEWRPGRSGYDPNWHDKAKEIEDNIREEHELPKRGTDHGLRPS